MKKIILLVLFAICASTSHAGMGELDFCTEISDKVLSFSEARYAGVPLSKVIQKVGAKSAYAAVVYETYKLPDYESRELQITAGTELANTYFRICMESK